MFNFVLDLEKKNSYLFIFSLLAALIFHRLLLRCGKAEMHVCGSSPRHEAAPAVDVQTLQGFGSAGGRLSGRGLLFFPGGFLLRRAIEMHISKSHVCIEN